MSGPTVVLIHGACHGSWCWEEVQRLASERGLRSVAVALPSCGSDPESLGLPTDDIAAVRVAIDAASGPVVLVGHSLGGVVMSEAAAGRPAVRHLVYLAAFMLEESQSTDDVIDPETASDWVLSPDGRSVTAADPAALFYAMCPPHMAAEAVARLRPQSSAWDVHRVAAAPWREIPTTYVVCLRDRAIPPAQQEEWATRAGYVERLDCDHSPFLSDPDAVVSIIERAVASALS